MASAIGATAMSSVMRSFAIACSDASRSNRGCRRTPAPAAISAAFPAGLHMATVAPTRSAAYSAKTSSGRFGDRSATRVPRVT